MDIREAARAVICNNRQQALLIKIEDQSVYDSKQSKKPCFWVTPGGSLEPGETYREAVKRELHEEIGLKNADIGPCLWHGEVELIWRGVPTTIRERYYLVRAAGHTIDLTNMTEDEKKVYCSHDWFSSNQMRECPDLILPKNLADLLDELYAHTGVVEEKEIDLSTPSESKLKSQQVV